MSQLTGYGFTSAIGQAGQIADSSMRVVNSFAAEAVVPFGAAVQRGTNPAKQVKPFIGGTFAGVAVFSHTEETGQYEIKGSAAVMSKGRVIVDTLAVSVTAGGIAYVVNDTGAWTGTDTLATAVGKFLTTGSGLQVVELN